MFLKTVWFLISDVLYMVLSYNTFSCFYIRNYSCSSYMDCSNSFAEGRTFFIFILKYWKHILFKYCNYNYKDLISNLKQQVFWLNIVKTLIFISFLALFVSQLNHSLCCHNLNCLKFFCTIRYLANSLIHYFSHIIMT